MNNVAEGIATFGREGLIDSCNAATARTFGLGQLEMYALPPIGSVESPTRPAIRTIAIGCESNCVINRADD